MTLLTDIVAVGLQEAPVGRCMNPVTCIALSVGYGLMNEFSLEILGSVAGKAKIGGLAGQEHRGLAPVRRVATTAHADPEGSVFFLTQEFNLYVAVETEARR